MKKPAWLTRKILIRGGAALVVGGAAIALVYDVQSGNVKAGIGADETITKSEKKDKQGNITETTTTITFQDAKTLWDWLSLLGVPFSLAILGYMLQQLQQARAEQQTKAEKEIADQRAKAEKEIVDQQAKAEKEIASQRTKTEKEIVESNQREEALQNYLDRLSDLLIDKNVIAIAVRLQADTENEAKDNPSHPTILEEKELLSAATDVIRARTLSILRRLGQDGDRKGNVIQFLAEAEVISKLKLNLSGADLSYINLSAEINLAIDHPIFYVQPSMGQSPRAILLSITRDIASLNETFFHGIDLSGVNLSNTNFRSAKLRGAKLTDANLSIANFSFADLSGANLNGADLRGTNLNSANLRNTDLHDARNLTETRLSAANLCETILPEECNLNPNRDCEALGILRDPPATESPE